MRTFPKVPGTNFDQRDYADAMARGREKAFSLHIGFERVEVGPNPHHGPGGGYAAAPTPVRETLTPRDLDDDELQVLAAQLNAQVRDADAKAVFLADEAKADFERRQAENIAALENVLAAIAFEDDRLNLGLRVARIDVKQKLDAQRSATFDRGEALRPNLARDSLKLAASEVSRELKSRRAAQAAEREKIKEMLQRAGIGL